MATVYILQSLRDGRYYIGSTVDLHARWRHHEGGFTHSTKRFGPLRIVLTQEYTTIEEARYVERRIKELKRKDYIEQMVKDGYIKIRKNKDD